MTQSAPGFVGLTMPVFTAFGWTGEEAALSFALSQLELFIGDLYGRLPRAALERLPYFGLSPENRNVYLSAAADVSSDIYIEFNVRPMSFEIQLCLTDKTLLAKALRQAERDPGGCFALFSELGGEWSLRVQQLQVDDESGEAGHYNDLYKGPVEELDEESTAEVVNKAAYLNGESQWVTPIYVSRRYPSEQASTMGSKVIDVMAQEVMALLPLISFFTAKRAKKSVKAAPKPKPEPEVDKAVQEIEVEAPTGEGFVYVAELKPLHLRRGFVNMTPEHWPFFAENSRSTIRDVTVHYEDGDDTESKVWRLVPNDLARLVLGSAAHKWLEDNFNPNDRIQIIARLRDGDKIQLTLKEIG